MRVLLSLCALATTACGVVGQPPSGAEQVADPTEQVLARSLEVGGCRGFDGAPSITGAWVFAFTTVATLSGGNLDGAQPETVTRYGVATVCQDDREVAMALLVCNLAQTPVFDTSRTCAAQLPSTAVLASLPPVTVTGTLGQPGPETSLSLSGWSERWGLAEDAEPPPEPPGVEPVDDEAVIDQDQDERPGVTLTGDSSVPTLSWAARLTRADFELTADEQRLVGTTRSETVQAIVGGPASRLLRGRTRDPRPGEAFFLRADGRYGSTRADADGDGRIRCAELGPLLDQLPEPPAAPCGR